MLVVVVCAIAQLPPSNDVAWQLSIGRRLAGGSELYRDIIEVNPPLWFWVAVPIVHGASLLGISGTAALVGFLGVSAAVSIALVQRLYANLWVALGLVLVFFAIGISATGQREQFTLIASTPYVFLAAARADRKAVPVWLAAFIGIWAVPGIALKHYFLLVPLALELWHMFQKRWSIRPEFVVLLFGGAAYLAAIAGFTPEYLCSMVPLIREAYGLYDRPLPVVLRSEVVIIAVAAFAGFTLLRSRSATVQALAVAGLAFTVAFVLQHKGWRYHGLPAIGMFSIMAIVALTEQTWSDLRSKAAAVVLGAVPLLALATTFNHLSKPDHRAVALFCALPRGSSVIVLSPYASVAWPAVERCGVGWASRYMFLWMLPKVDERPHLHAALARSVRSAIAEDIALHNPDLILVEQHAFDFVMSDPAVRSKLASYDRSSTDQLTIFRRRMPVRKASLRAD